MYSYNSTNTYAYRIPQSFNPQSNITILYKNMEIKWVLQEFSNNRAYKIAKKILNLTNNTTYYGTRKIFICKKKKELDLIYEILYKEYYMQNSIPDINLLEIVF